MYVFDDPIHGKEMTLMERRARDYEWWKDPTVADGCWTHGWRHSGPEDGLIPTVVFPVFLFDGDIILKTTKMVKVNRSGIVIFDTDDLAPIYGHSLNDKLFWEEKRIDLINAVDLADFSEQMDRGLVDKTEVQLWKNKDGDGREVIVIMKPAEEEPTAVQTIARIQRCSKSPIGLHVKMFTSDGLPWRIGPEDSKAYCCKHCGQVLHEMCFPE